MDISPPVRAVYLTAEALGVKLEHVETSLQKRDHLKPEFVKVRINNLLGVYSFTVN